jgi:hypothetical protein
VLQLGAPAQWRVRTARWLKRLPRHLPPAPYEPIEAALLDSALPLRRLLAGQGRATPFRFVFGPLKGASRARSAEYPYVHAPTYATTAALAWLDADWPQAWPRGGARLARSLGGLPSKRPGASAPAPEREVT